MCRECIEMAKITTLCSYTAFSLLDSKLKEKVVLWGKARSTAWSSFSGLAERPLAATASQRASQPA
jgi:hypothetical protein